MTSASAWENRSALGGTRTPNLLIRSQMLYPLSYERRCVASLRHLEPVLCQLPGSAAASGDEFRGGTDVGAFALLADEAEVLDGTGAGGPEPVRGAGVELGGFPRLEDEVVLAEDQAERAVEHVDPVVALVGPQVGYSVVVSGRADELVGLDAAGPAGQGQDDRSVLAGHGAQVDAGITGRRGVDEFVEGDAVGAGQREELLERGAPQARLEPGQGAGGDAGFLREVGERDVAAEPQPLQPRPDGVEGAVKFIVHHSILPFGNKVCQSACHRVMLGST